MVADWSRWLPLGFGRDWRAGVMKAINGDIGAIPISTVTKVFCRSDTDHKKVLMGSMRERIIYPSRVDPFTWRPVPLILQRRKFPCNLKDMELSHGTSDWRCRP